MMITPSVKKFAKFDPGKFQGVLLALTPHSKTMLVCLEAGQAIPVHHPPVDLTMTILEGEATMVAGEDELEHAGPGAVMHAGAGQARGIHADKRTMAVVVVSPPPTDEDHKEVFEHMKRGTWR